MPKEYSMEFFMIILKFETKNATYSTDKIGYLDILLVGIIDSLRIGNLYKTR